MKRIAAIILLIACIITLASCKKDKYPAVESTKEESQTVMTLTIGKNKYDVKYELYRALFLNYKTEVDGGDSSVWNSDGKAEYVEKIDAMIINRIVEIYAAFEICDRIGFDVYSDEVEDQIKENIRISVEGGTYGSTTIHGYESYDAYLAALKKVNLNYSVQTLLFRYAIATDAIDTYYIGTASSDDINANTSEGHLEYTIDDVKSFYNSDDCARVLRASFQTIITYTPLADAEKLRNKLMDAASTSDDLDEKENAVFVAIMSSGKYSSVSEVEDGYVIGKYNLEESFYGEMTNAALALEIGEVSEPIEIVTDLESSYYVLYKAQKSDVHFEENYESIKYVYLMNCVGKMLHEVEVELKSSVGYSDFLRDINHADISMD